MLRFAVFDENGPASDWVLRHAHLFGPDDVPIASEVNASNGIITCEKRGNESAGLCLQFPVDATEDGDIGTLTLSTCLLPERDRPYLLTLELARRRLMMLLNKLEDWALFDLPPEGPVLGGFERARRAFTEAIVSQHNGRDNGTAGYTLETDRLARRALALAIQASETLALWQAKGQLEKRMSGELVAAAKAMQAPANAITEHEAMVSRNALLGAVGVILPTPPQLGVTVSPQQFSPVLHKAVGETSDFLCMPMRWMDMEPTEGRYLFGQTDRWIEWAVRHAKLPVVGGPIIDFRPNVVPEWLYIWEHDYETLRELVYEHVRQIVTRYRRTVPVWTVASGLHVNKNFTLTIEQVMDLTRLCVTIVKKLQSNAVVQVEIDQPWGDYAATGQRSIPPLLYAEMMLQAGLSVDVFGLRIDMGQPEPGRSTRDMMMLSALLDKYAVFERPIALSALSAPARAPDADDTGLKGELEPGFWRNQWSEAAQSQWMTQVLAVAASKPYVHTVCWRELYDSDKPAQLQNDGLLDANLNPRQSLQRFAEIRRGIRTGEPFLDANVGVG